jgi:hypothetical protein
VTFRLYDAQIDGTEVWSESFATVDVNAGSFTSQLGATAPLASGSFSSVSGGWLRTAGGTHNWRAGNLFESN